MISQIKLQHLYWRGGFGLSPSELNRYSKYSLKKNIDILFKNARKTQSIKITKFKSVMDYGMKDVKMKKKIELENDHQAAQINADWILRMANEKENCLLEKMTLFWHGHFACINKPIPKLIQDQLNTIRKHALGNFKDLVLAMSKDVSMIKFLNNQQNKKESPNENYARELLELFTIGIGNYSEQDIKEAARAFTGWSSNSDGDFIFRKHQHDFGTKVFMGEKGNFDGEDIIDILLSRKETAYFITRKIYRYFINEKVDENQLNYFSNIFYNSKYNIEKLMRAIFESKWFYNTQNIGVKIKSPVELIAGILRISCLSLNDVKSLNFLSYKLGQTLFKPPSVAGWPSGKLWIDNATLTLRLNLVNILFVQGNLKPELKSKLAYHHDYKRLKNLHSNADFSHLSSIFGTYSVDELVDLMPKFLLQPPLKMKKASLKKCIAPVQDKNIIIQLLCIKLMGLPEYQLC